MGSANRRQLTDDVPMMMRAALQGWQAGLWTAIPGYVTEFDAAKQTVSVQPTIMGRFADEVGKLSWIKMPLLVDCPVMWPSGGGYSLTFPVKPDDEVLVVFSSRCIDAWWQSGGIQVQAELRMHDLSDGFAFFSPRSQPKMLSDVASDGVVLRNDSGSATIKIDDDADISVITDGNVNVNSQKEIIAVANTKITAQAPNIELSGNVHITGNLVVTGNITTPGGVQGSMVVGTTEVAGGGITLSKHQHGGVTNGGSKTSGPSNF